MSPEFIAIIAVGVSIMGFVFALHLRAERRADRRAKNIYRRIDRFEEIINRRLDRLEEIIKRHIDRFVENNNRHIDRLKESANQREENRAGAETPWRRE